jgi:excisionase family DNA binding protein
MTDLAPVKNDLRPFYTTRSLARRLSLSERTVRDLIRRGDIPSYKVAGARRIDRSTSIRGSRNDGKGMERPLEISTPREPAQENEPEWSNRLVRALHGLSRPPQKRGHIRAQG